MSSLFCRHNRFTADCPICSKGTVLDPSAPGVARAPGGAAGERRRPAATRPAAGRGAAAGGGDYRGPYASAGPYERDGERYEVRLERVPGGLRLGAWSGGRLLRRAPVLPAADVGSLVDAARSRGVARPRDLEPLARALAGGGEGGPGPAPPPFGASPGRAGDMAEELRVEPLEGGLVRFARWTRRPGGEWELKNAPTMYPALRYAEALAGAARARVVGALR